MSEVSNNRCDISKLAQIPAASLMIFLMGFQVALAQTTNVLKGHAFRAAEFYGSLGVNVHSALGKNDIQALQNQLTYLGFAHIRDGLNSVKAEAFMPKMISVSQIGVRWDVVIQQDPKLEQSWLDTYAGYLDAIEGPNEVNLKRKGAQAAVGIAAGTQIQQALFTMVKNDNSLRNIPVLNFSIGHAWKLSNISDIPVFADYANIHSYSPKGLPPREEILKNIALFIGDHHYPVVFSELGYTTVKYTESSARQGLEGVDELTQAKYLGDAVFDDFIFGVNRTYIYDLRDDPNDPENLDKEFHFGLFYNDGTPKISATMFHNLVTILQDKRPDALTFETGTLSYRWSVRTDTSNAENLSSVLLQKENGIFYLVLWAEPNLWNSSEHVANAAIPVQSVTLQLSGKKFDIDVYDPLISPTSQLHQSDADTVSLSVSDHPIIVELDDLQTH